MIFGRKKNRETAGTGRGKAWYDLHGHFLPAMDDGCKSVEESLEVLSTCRRKGIVGMIATPHYYPEESIERFLERRMAAAVTLRQAASETGAQVPEWCMGAEVAYYEGVIRAEGLERLCLGKSRYLLLELPFDRWNNNVIRDVYELTNLYNITPILAHLERYLDLQSRDMLEQLYEADVLIQMNGGYILKNKRDAKKRILNGLVQVLGSDTHNMTTRRPNLREAVESLRTDGIEEQLEDIRLMNRNVFLTAMGQ